MQTPPRFDFGSGQTPPAPGSQPTGNNPPPYFPPPPYREEAPLPDMRGRSGLGRVLPALITVSAFGGLALLGWFAYQEGRHPVSDGELPVIKAESDEFKREPENPGGEVIPHMDKEVYNSYSGQDKQAAAPAPQPADPSEQPIDRNFLKQFAGTGEEESGDEDGGLKQETVAFGQQPQPVAPVAPAVPAGSAPSAPLPDARSALEPKPLIADAPTPNTGGVALAPAEQPETAPEPEGEPALPPLAAYKDAKPVAPLPSAVAPAPLPLAPSHDPFEDAAVEKSKPVVIQDEKIEEEKVVAPKAAAPKAVVKKETKAAKPAAKKETKPAAKTKAVKGSDLRLQLGAFRTEAEAKAEWKRLQGKFKSSLGSLSILTEKADIAGKGVMFRLQAGPLKSKDAGRALCKKLTAAGQGCFVVQ